MTNMGHLLNSKTQPSLPMWVLFIQCFPDGSLLEIIVKVLQTASEKSCKEE